MIVSDFVNPYHYFLNRIANISSDFSNDIHQLGLLQGHLNTYKVKVDLPKKSKLIVDFENALHAIENGESSVFPIVLGKVSIEYNAEMLRYLISVSDRELLNAERNINFSNSMLFIQVVAFMDAALMEFVREILNRFPYLVLPYTRKNGKIIFDSTQHSFSYLEILEVGSLEELKNRMIDKKVDKLGRQSVEEQINFFDKIFKTNLDDSFSMSEKVFPYRSSITIYDSNDSKNDANLYELQQKQLLIEIREARNLHVHNKGIINDIYLSNTLSFNLPSHLTSLGEYRKIDTNYLVDSVEICSRFIAGIAHSIVNKFIPAKALEEILAQKALFDKAIDDADSE